MIFPDVHKRMTTPNTRERLLGVFHKESVGITVNQPAAEFFQRVFYGKNLAPMIEIEWAGPIG